MKGKIFRGHQQQSTVYSKHNYGELRRNEKTRKSWATILQDNVMFLYTCMSQKMMKWLVQRHKYCRLVKKHYKMEPY